MASPYQQQVFQRKLVYIGAILVLFTASLVWRRNVIDDLAGRLAIREESRGEVEVTGAAVRLTLTGLRGLATCVLWNAAIDKQKKNQWNELEVLVRMVTKLQPHFITPWLFQSWNLSYNVSVESDRVRDKYYYIARGLQLLASGERQNLHNPDLRWSMGFYLQNKIIQSDESNVHRSLFQLSLIKPSDRAPDRFWGRDKNDVAVFKDREFAAFAREHPQLVRRLRLGIHRDNLHAKRQQFTCQKPQDVVQFLDDNWEVPSLYDVPARKEGAASDAQGDRGGLLAPEDRFPVLPPPADARGRAGERPVRPPERVFDPEALTTLNELKDDVDANAIGHAWFCYAQEPIPPCGDTPGSTREATDRATQRKPKHMTTLIFRHYPAQARRFQAERLQAERWFDKEGWDVGERDDDQGWKAVALELLQIAPREEGTIGGGREWSLDAWTKTKVAWQQHGERNKLLFLSPQAERNMRDLAKAYWDRMRRTGQAAPAPRATSEDLARMGRRQREDLEESRYSGRMPPTREEDLSPQELDELRAAQFMFEWRFYRNVSNFNVHYQRSLVEARPETVAVRKVFSRAEDLNLAGSWTQALDLYRRPRRFPNSAEQLSPLDAWLKLVLQKNQAFRDLEETQQQTAEIQIAYLDLYDQAGGWALKKKLAGLAPLLPLVPPTSEEAFPRAIVVGPFDGTDEAGEPIVARQNMDTVLQRKGRLPRAPASMPKGAGRPKRPPLK